jgi:hypothetical protein
MTSKKSYKLRRRDRMRSRAFVRIAAVFVICCAAGCKTIHLDTFPAPLTPCATDEDLIWVVERVGRFTAWDYQRWLRVIDSVAYCQTAEAVLGGRS